jgi:predicted permease
MPTFDRRLRPRRWLADLGGDLRFAARSVRAQPGLAATVLLTAALGIGVTSAVWSLVNTVLMRSLPYPDPDRIVMLMSTWRGRASIPGVSTPKFFEWRRATDVFQASAAYRLGGVMNLTTPRDPQQVAVGRVSAGFFDLFGARAARGRTFRVDEDRPGGARVVVVSDEFWRRRLGASPDAVGQVVSLDGEGYDIVGVLEAGFDADPLALSLGPRPDLWLPLQLNPAGESDAPFLAAARLRDGTSLELARAQTQAAVAAIRRAFPAVMPDQAGLDVEPLHSVVVRDIRPSLLLLFAAVALVLLIVCANTAHLLLVRASARRREMAIRLASGASRSRIVRQLLTESLALAVPGGVLGVWLALYGLRALVASFAGAMPPVVASHAASAIDGRVLAFTLITSLAAGILFGIVPALQASRVDLDAALRGGGPRARPDARRRMRGLLVMSEMALASMLLVSSGLLIRSFMALRDVDPGFETRGVLTMQMAITGPRFATVEATSRIVRDALQHVQTIAGVDAAAATVTGAPLSGITSFLNITIPGRRLDGPYFHGGYLGGWQVVSPRYFDVLDIAVVAGRTFTDADDRTQAPVVVINELMARQFWPGESPLGRYLLIGEGAGPEFEETTPRQIVGIAGDVRHVGLEWPPRPTAYVPLAQLPANQLSVLNRNGGRLTWLVRTQTGPKGPVLVVERELERASAGVPLAAVRSMQDVSAASTVTTQFTMWLMAVFGVSALALAAIGVFGVMAFTVRQRTREIGIRLALGAAARNVRNMVLLHGMSLSLAGIVSGLAAAAMLTRLLDAVLFGVDPHDWRVFVSMPLLLAGVALVAVWLPARRATIIEPIAALRHD